MKKDKFESLLGIILKSYGVNYENVGEFSRKKDNVYIILLMMRKYYYLHDKRIKEILGIDEKNINIELRRAEEKVLTNVDFRGKYFGIEEWVKKII